MPLSLGASRDLLPQAHLGKGKMHCMWYSAMLRHNNHEKALSVCGDRKGPMEGGNMAGDGSQEMHTPSASEQERMGETVSIVKCVECGKALPRKEAVFLFVAKDRPEMAFCKECPKDKTSKWLKSPMI
jgi:hypothetical protein